MREMVGKMERLLRHHRQHVFDEDEHVSNTHQRAIDRIKKTKTFLSMCRERELAEKRWMEEKLNKELS